MQRYSTCTKMVRQDVPNDSSQNRKSDKDRQTLAIASTRLQTLLFPRKQISCLPSGVAQRSQIPAFKPSKVSKSHHALITEMSMLLCPPVQEFEITQLTEIRTSVRPVKPCVRSFTPSDRESKVGGVRQGIETRKDATDKHFDSSTQAQWNKSRRNVYGTRRACEKKLT